MSRSRCATVVAAFVVLGPSVLGAEQQPGFGVHGDVRLRWLNVEIDGRPPRGLYGELLTEQTAFQHRLILEIEGRVAPRIRAGGLVRLSNEPDEVLRLGPDYLSQSFGSAFVALTLPALRARGGYYRTYFTPLALMRWDAEDVSLGGAQRACAVCGGGVTAAVLLESLEDIQPELTFEGARLDAGLGDAVDVSLVYARPQKATIDLVPGLGIADEETFQYHRDLYAGRLSWSALHRPTLTFRRFGVTLLHARDDENNPPCPTLPELPLCRTIENTAFGLDTRFPIATRLVLEGEWLRTAHRADAREDAAGARWANGWRLTGEIGIVPEVVWLRSAFLHLQANFETPYNAVTYISNRSGWRHRLVGRYAFLEGEVFLRWLGAIDREWVEEGQAALNEQRLTSVQLTASLPKHWLARLGYQHEVQRLDLVAGAEAELRSPRRDITLIEAGYASDALQLIVDQQWIREEDPLRSRGSGTAAITSVSAQATF